MVEWGIVPTVFFDTKAGISEAAAVVDDLDHDIVVDSDGDDLIRTRTVRYD